MRKGRKMMTFYVTAEQSAALRAHSRLEGESGRALIVRLLTTYLADPTSMEAGRVPTRRATVRKSIDLDDEVVRLLHEHTYETGESGAALVRRLLESYFSSRLA